MIPGKALSVPTLWYPYLPPDGIPTDPLTSYQLGGIGLSDSTQGLQVQPWKLEVIGPSTMNQFVISSPNTSPTVLYSYPNVTQCSLSFDPNMKPAIAFTGFDGPQLWWYDATIPGYTSLYLPQYSLNPQITLDDKRPNEERLGTIDIILTYTRNNNLYYRQLRDRFTIEYVLAAPVQLSNPQCIKVGMNNGWRLQWYMQGNLYQ